MKYVALLRGINVGGNNKVAMQDLKVCFEQSGYTDVTTYINSGNVLFSSNETSEVALVKRCEQVIEKQFGFPVVVMVISAAKLIEAVNDAPNWWASGDPKIYRSEALYVIPPTTAGEVLSVLQKKTSSVDRLATRGQVVFWTLPREEYNKSIVPKIIGTPVYRRITMRSATTTRKLYDLAKN